MIQDITKLIDALPPLPQTLIKLEEFKQKSVQEPIELLQILEQDPLIMATLLKIANSAMFGFRNKVETTKKAIELIGVNFTLSIAFGSAIKSTLNTNLEAYHISSDEFIELSNMSSNLLSRWLGPCETELKEQLLLPVFLQETGKFVLSNLAVEKNKADEFYKEIKDDVSKISKIEKAYFGASSSEVTAIIFEQWGLDDKLINIIKNVDRAEKVDEKYKKATQILSVIKVLCNPIDPLSDTSVEEGIKLAKLYKLDSRYLTKAIDIMQDRILDAM
jgi:HD-like signal output (HDOD) protein